MKLKYGYHRVRNWLIFIRDGKYSYGFRINRRTISEDQKKLENPSE